MPGRILYHEEFDVRYRFPVREDGPDGFVQLRLAIKPVGRPPHEGRVVTYGRPGELPAPPPPCPATAAGAVGVTDGAAPAADAAAGSVGVLEGTV